MKIVRNNIIPFGRGFGAINLFGILFIKRDVPVSPRLINHEAIHSRQMRELLFVPFYVIYVVEWLARLVCRRGDCMRAYHDISFEREAYRHDGDLSYLKTRRPFAQWREN